ncbi:MAG: Ig-like domain-containing protein, partial [Duncaniella sp.]|nr:Ig-like domain-containing protein [Duncaniella sp.]
KEQKEGYYYEVSFRSLGYNNLVLNVSFGGSYNTYNKFDVEYSIDGGENYKKVETYDVTKAWKDFVTALPEDAAGKESVKIRFMPVTTSGLNDGSSTTLDGLCIADLYILADRDSASDETAPVLISTIPADNAEGASATGSIILTFDEKVKVGTGNATLNGETLSAKESGKSMVYTYAGLAYGTTYKFTVPAGAITDRNGNAFEGTTITFTTLERQQPESRLFDAIVAADGSGDHTTLQAAIDAAPTQSVKPYLIFVKNGRYHEHINIPTTKPNLHIIGQDRDEAVIWDDKLCGGDNALHVSVGATVVVNANDCMFENITLENSYGHEKQDGPQALALNTSGDRTILNNVALLSYQDTWITPSTSSYRAYVRNSLIEGAVDFIYNSGDIYIENTTLLITRKSGGYIVAPSHDKDVKWGYVFNNCTITAPGVPSETSVWLGRPWHNYPKTVFLNTRAEVTIPAAGWHETMGGLPALWADWNTVDANGNPVDLSQRRDTYYRMENDQKVYGKAKNFLTDQEAAEYTVRNVLSGGDNWEPVIKTEACKTPEVIFDGNTLSWNEVPYAICYLITRGGKVIDFVKETSYTVTPARDGEETEPYKVQAVNEFGGLSAKGIAGDKSAIDTVDASADIIAIEYFDLSGIRLTEPVKGVNIVRTIYADGHVSVDKHVLR